MKARLFWPVVLSLLAADCTTKRLAVEHLSPPRVPHEVVGDWVRFTLTYNPDAALGVSLGPYSRVGFAVLAAAALVVILLWYRATPPEATARGVALALILAGAAGNLLDRLRSAQGVVDFIDVGVGSVRFWTFNVADACITVGALILAAGLWRRGAPHT